MNCKTCNEPIPYKTIIDGKMKILCTRRYCLKCHPWGIFAKKDRSGRACLRCFRPVGNLRGQYCASCTQILHRKKKKKELVNYKGGKCEICGYDRCISNLVFHHRDPEKKDFSLSAALPSRSIAALKHEVDKCAMICCRCHGEVHEGLISIPLLKFP